MNRLLDVIRNLVRFSLCQIRIYNNFFTKGSSNCFKGLNYKTVNDYKLNNGEQTYIVKDIEVYNIETIDIQ